MFSIYSVFQLLSVAERWSEFNVALSAELELDDNSILQIKLSCGRR